MLEGDDDSMRRKLERAKKDPSVSPNLKYQLEKQVKTGEKQKLATLQKELARKELKEKQTKLKQEMTKKGVMSADQKLTAEQIQKQEKTHEQAQKAQGQTEEPTQTV